MTKLPLAAAGLLLAGLALTGCGGGSSASDAGSSAPASSAAAAPSAAAPSTAVPSGAASGATPSAGASGSAGAAATLVTDPCQVLDAGTVADLSGVKVKDGTTQDVGGSKVCTWSPQDGTAKGAAVFSAQEGPLPAGLGQVADQLKTQFAGQVSALSVSGADDARYITGKTSGLEVIDVLAAKDQRFYQVLVAAPKDAGQHKKAAVAIAQALLTA